MNGCSSKLCTVPYLYRPDLPELLQSQLQESKQTKSQLGWKKMIMVPATDWINKQWPCCVLYVLTSKGATYPDVRKMYFLTYRYIAALNMTRGPLACYQLIWCMDLIPCTTL